MSILRTFMEFAIERETEWISQGYEGLTKVMAQDSEGTGFIFILVWNNERELLLLLTSLRRTFAERNIVRYVAINEGWVAVAVPGEDRPPSQRPDSHEILHIIGVERLGLHRAEHVVTCPIVTDGEGKRRLGAPQWDTMQPIDSLMDTLLDTEH